MTPDVRTTTDPVSRAPLSRSQFYYWYLLNGLPPESRHRWNVSFSVPLPDDASTEQVDRTVQLLVARHDALRCVIDDTGPEPVQVILPECRIDVTHREVPRSDDETRATCETDLAAAEIDLEHGPTVRAQVVSVQGRPTWAIMVVHHLYVTRRTMTTLEEEFQQVLENLVAGRSGDDSLAPANGTGHRVAYEMSERGVERAKRSNDHLAGVFSTLPNVSFPYTAQKEATGPGTLQVLTLHSPALKRAVDAAARRFKLPPCSILFAAGDFVLSSYTGHDVGWSVAMDTGPVDPSRVQIECTLQNVFISLKSAQDSRFSRSIQRSYRNLLLGNFYGDHDHARLVEDMADTASTRATRTIVNLWFNCVASSVPGSGEPSADTAVPLRTLREQSRFAWDKVVDSRVLVALECGDLGTELRLDLWSGGELIRQADMPRVLEAVESLLCRLATEGDVDLAEERAALQAHGWPREPDASLLAPGLWVDVPATEELLSRHQSVRKVAVSVAANGPGDRPDQATLTARVEAVEPVPTAADLRRFGLGRLRDPGVVIPDRFDIVEIPGDSGTVVATRTDEAATAEHALRAVLETVLGTETVALNRSYREQGGNARRLPAVKRRLVDAGWSCPTLYDDLLSPLSISEVAAQMRYAKEGSA